MNSVSTTAQEQIGLRLENYAGINSAFINPANPLSYPLQWDLNIVSASQFADNNYAYIVESNLLKIIKNNGNIHTPLDESNIRPDQIELDFNVRDNNYYVSVFSQVTGPSFSVKIGDENSIGFFTNLRAAFSAQSIPNELGYYQVYQNQVTTPLEVEPSIAVGMVWSEIGLSYARKIYTGDGYLGIGGSFKFLNGYEAGFAENRTAFTAIQQVADTFSLNTPDIEFGYTTSNVDMVDGNNFSKSRNGGGVALDLGVTYVYEGNEDNYKLKLGASILDFGRIKFDRNADKYRVGYDGTMEFTSADYRDFTTPDEVAEELSQQIYGNLTDIKVANQFSVWLPTALSLQADYMVMPMFYVNGLLVQRFPKIGVGVQRGNMMSVTPRFEHRWFSAALPLVVYNYSHFNVGASLRLGFLTIGSDNLGSLIGNSDFYGTDFYVGLKINPFDLGLNLGGGGGFGGGGKKVKCYDF